MGINHVRKRWQALFHGEVCFVVKVVYKKRSITRGEVAVIKVYRHFDQA